MPSQADLAERSTTSASTDSTGMSTGRRVGMLLAFFYAFMLLAIISADALGAQTPPASQAPTPAQRAAGNAPGATAASSAAPQNATGPAAATRPARSSWTADRRDFAVGEIITILIDDYTISTAIKENLATNQRTRDLDLDAQLPTSSKSVGLSTRNGATQQQRGSTRNENRFQNEMSVRIAAIDANGVLQLKGTKKIHIDKNKQDITLTGYARAQDISAQNYVESNRVADITIGYASPGNLGKPKQGLVSKILGAFWP